jgi:DNA-binding NarL/FixJ family response regulator
MWPLVYSMAPLVDSSQGRFFAILTCRLYYVAKGLSNGEVAARIGRTEGTVKVHLKNILQKLGANDRTEAITTALRCGFIRLD